MDGEGIFHGGKAVEPGEDEGGWLAIEEALVELFTDAVGEAGDFAASGGLPWFMAEVVVFFKHAASLAEEAEKA
jgi:hypothetical protein